MSENLKIWEAVATTDPKFTKPFSKAGGFSGTAINATYLIRKATELWGPMGGKWGPEVADEKYVTGAEGTIIHVLRINMKYPGGALPSFGQTTFVGQNKHGMFTDEEAPKKSLTDAITKALSMLGFSADVFLGAFDDNKYINDKREQAARITPISGSLDALNKDDQAKAKQIANSIVDLWNEDKPVAAYEAFYEANLSNEMKLGVWEVLQPHSKIRNGIKKIADENKRKAA